MKELDITSWSEAKQSAAIETARGKPKAHIIIRWDDASETVKPETPLDATRRQALLKDRLRA